MDESKMPERIQLSRAKGWRMPENTVKVDRTSRWGNPYSAETFGLERAITLFENTVQGLWSPGLFADAEPDSLVELAYLLHTSFRARHRTSFGIAYDLGGKNLACWCKAGEPCHADVLLELANKAQ